MPVNHPVGQDFSVRGSLRVQELRLPCSEYGMEGPQDDYIRWLLAQERLLTR